jgi:glycine/D-amino acid oxidase-like deaminating enzyme
LLLTGITDPFVAPMNRRTLLKTCGLGLAAWGAGPATKRLNAWRLVPAAGPIVPVRASWDRVVTTLVGLRPHRDAGFLVTAHKLDAKTIIHNYGHGGAGMSLGWGSSALAADLALPHDDRRAAIIGCGSLGLTTARQLQRRGFAVTIYAASIPPQTTSNMSMATFTPASGLVDAGRRTPEWNRQFRQAAEISYRELQRLVGTTHGVSWTSNYHATDDLRAAPTPLQRDERRVSEILPEYLRADHGREVLGPHQHPFPAKYAVRTMALSIEPSIYLEALMRDVTAEGGRITVRAFETPQDLLALDEALIVNATGLGARALFGDRSLVPIKGQLTVLAAQPEVNYRVSARLKHGVIVGMHPRTDGIVLGNLADRGNWSLEPDEEVRQRMVDSAITFFSAMKAEES